VDHQKKISEVNLMMELSQSTMPTDEVDFKELQSDYDYYQVKNILNFLLENGLVTSGEKSKIEMDIRYKMKPFLYELYGE
jgi:hypothetical protein